MGHLESGRALAVRLQRLAVVAGAERGRAGDAARRAVDDIDAARLQLPRERDGVLDGPAVRAAVDGGDAEEQGQVLRPDSPDRRRDLEREAHASGEVSAVAVVTRVGQRRQEGMDQVAMRRVHLEDLEAGLQRAARGGGEFRHH